MLFLRQYFLKRITPKAELLMRYFVSFWEERTNFVESFCDDVFRLKFTSFSIFKRNLLSRFPWSDRQTDCVRTLQRGVYLG